MQLEDGGLESTGRKALHMCAPTLIFLISLPPPRGQTICKIEDPLSLGIRSAFLGTAGKGREFVEAEKGVQIRGARQRGEKEI